MLTIASARQAPEQSRLGGVLVLSALLHLVLVSAIRIEPPRFELPRPAIIELTLEQPVPEPAPVPEAPEVAAPTAVPPPPAVRYRDKQPVAAAPGIPAEPRLSSTFYEQVQDGDLAINFVSQEREEQKLEARFTAPTSPYNSDTKTSAQAPATPLKEERFRDGNMRVTYRDWLGRKRCLEARPDDLLDEFDYGGWFVPVAIGC
jgi:hypothetical protein